MDSQKINEYIDEKYSAMPLELKAKMYAISHLRAKFTLLDNDITVEEEFEKLADYWALKGGVDDYKQPISDHRNAYMEKIFNDLFEKHSEYFDFAEDRNDKLGVYVGYNLKSYLFSSIENKDFRDASIKAYYPLLSEYIQFIAKYIVENNRYELSSSNPEDLKNYVDLQKYVNEKINTSTNGSVVILAEDMVQNVLPKVQNLIQSNLSDSFYDNIISAITVPYIWYVQSIIHGPLANIEVQGLNDLATQQKMLDLANKVTDSIELDEGKKQLFDIAVSKINESIKQIQASSSGCVVFFAILSTALSSAIWGLSYLLI